MNENRKSPIIEDQGQTENNHSGGEPVSIIAEKPATLIDREELVTDFIMQNRRAHDIYCMGREHGYVQGHADGRRDAGNAAELAARTFIALSATDAHNRAQAADTAKSLDVPRMASKPMPTATIKPTPSLAQFLTGLRAGGILTDQQEAAK